MFFAADASAPCSGIKTVRVGIFYDGNYFLHVSNYYFNQHERRARISVKGLHSYIKKKVADVEKVPEKLCSIIESHYFRGRLSAIDAQATNKLYSERVFEDILMGENVVTHYMPVKIRNGNRTEKGVDVWLALEALELTMLKRFDVVVLIASDGDYVPLVRKLNSLGTRVMVFVWDYEFEDELGQKRQTRTAYDLINEATYPVFMHDVIDNRLTRNDVEIKNLFVEAKPERAGPDYETEEEIADRQVGYNSRPSFPTNPENTYRPQVTETTPSWGSADTYRKREIIPAVRYNDEDLLPYKTEKDGLYRSSVIILKNQFGFIKFPNNNLFFHAADLASHEFSYLQEGDEVEFGIGQGKNGENVAKAVTVIL